MGIEEIQREVMHASEKEAQRITEQAETEAKDILAVAKQKVKDMEKEATAQVKKEVEKLQHKQLEAAQFEANTAKLKLQKELLDNALEQAYADLQKLPDKKREEHLTSLLSKAQQDIDVDHVICAKKDTKLVKDVDAQEGCECGGLIAENKDSSLRVDLCYDTIFNDVVEENLQEINKVLFK